MTYTTTYEWSFRIPEEHDDMRDFEGMNKKVIETGRMKILKDEKSSRVLFRFKVRYYTEDEEAQDEVN